jgi:hypothetical protein
LSYLPVSLQRLANRFLGFLKVKFKNTVSLNTNKIIYTSSPLRLPTSLAAHLWTNLRFLPTSLCAFHNLLQKCPAICPLPTSLFLISLYFPTFLFTHLSICPPFYFFYLSTFLFAHLSICPPSACSPFYLPTFLFVLPLLAHISICPPIYLHTFLFAHLSICPPFYVPTSL